MDHRNTVNGNLTSNMAVHCWLASCCALLQDQTKPLCLIISHFYSTLIDNTLCLAYSKALLFKQL